MLDRRSGGIRFDMVTGGVWHHDQEPVVVGAKDCSKPGWSSRSVGWRSVVQSHELKHTWA